MMRRDWRIRTLGAIALLAALAAGGLRSAAQAATLAPLKSEMAATLPSGQTEVLLGASYFNNARYPYFTPPDTVRNSDTLSAPELGFRIGAGGWAEIQASYEFLYNRESYTNGGKQWHYGSGDLRLFTKLRLLSENDSRPGIGLRFGTKLPNANQEDRLGTDEIDFMSDVLISKDLGPVSLHSNLGLTLLDTPSSTLNNAYHPGGQDDLFTYTVAAVSKPLGPADSGRATVRLMAEANGQTGSKYNNDRYAFRLGMQMSRGPLMLYAGPSIGLVTESEDFGLFGGVVYTFDMASLFADEAPPTRRKKR